MVLVLQLSGAFVIYKYGDITRYMRYVSVSVALLNMHFQLFFQMCTKHCRVSDD